MSALVHHHHMNLSDLRDAPDTAADLAASSLQRISDVSLPDVSLSDVSLPDALDVDVVDLAGSAIEFAGDVAGAVVTHSGRSLGRAIRSARRNPKVALSVVAIIVLAIGLLAAKRRSSEPGNESIS